MESIRRTGILWQAKAGACVWMGMLALSILRILPLGLTEIIFLLAPLVIVPLGLHIAAVRMAQGRENMLFMVGSELQPWAASMVVAAFCLPKGIVSAALAMGWLTECACLGLCGLQLLARMSFRSIETLTFSVAFLYLPIGAVGLIASRLGWGMMDFKEPIVLLTAVHFHYAGFAAPILTGAAERITTSASRNLHKILRVSAWGVIATPGLVAIGFMVSPLLKLLSAFLLAASLILLSAIIFETLPAVRLKVCQWLLGISAISTPIAMILACAYAVGDFAGHELITIPQMAAIHGVLNSFGFALCGLFAWSTNPDYDLGAVAAQQAEVARSPLELRTP